MTLIVAYRCEKCGVSCCVFGEYTWDAYPPMRCPYDEANENPWVEIMWEEC